MLLDYENRTSIKAEKNTGQSVKHSMVNSGSVKSSLRRLPVKSVCPLHMYQTHRLPGAFPQRVPLEAPDSQSLETYLQILRFTLDEQAEHEREKVGTRTRLSPEVLSCKCSRGYIVSVKRPKL